MLKFKAFIEENYSEENSEEKLDEVLSTGGRIKKRQSAKKYRGRLGMSRRIWNKRKAPTARLGRRSGRGAQHATRKKWIPKGKSWKDLSFGQKASIERRTSTAAAKSRKSRLKMRLMPVKRRLDLQR